MRSHITCLGWGGEDGSDRRDIGVLELVDFGHLDAGVGQLFHGLYTRRKCRHVNFERTNECGRHRERRKVSVAALGRKGGSDVTEPGVGQEVKVR